MPRVGLNAETVVSTAAAIADESGLEAVTLAAVAERLSVKPPSLYKHVDGLDAIRREIALKGLRELNARIIHAIVGLTREEALVRMAWTYWRFSREHPGLYAATLRAPKAGEAEIEAAGDILIGVVGSVLEGFDLNEEDTLHAIRAVRAIVHGFVSLNALGGFGLALDVEESLLILMRVYAHALASWPRKPRKQRARVLPPDYGELGG